MLGVFGSPVSITLAIASKTSSLAFLVVIASGVNLFCSAEMLRASNAALLSVKVKDHHQLLNSHLIQS